MKRMCLALVTVTFMAVPGSADDIEDPNFRTWSKFKVGTVIVVKYVMEGPKSKTESLVTTTLVERKADAIMIEVTGTSVTNGKETKSPARKEQINKTRGRKYDESDDGYFPAVKEGSEAVTIDGVEYKTKWKTFPGDEKSNLKMQHTIWFCDDVPGRIVKADSKSEDKQSGRVNTFRSILISVKQP